MIADNTILNELKELNSSLVDAKADTYRVPEGYFAGLPELMLQRVRALAAVDPRAELEALSPMLAGFTREMPYKVPVGYFEELGASAAGVASIPHADVDEELQALSPLLGGLKKEMPYQVPEGYFGNISIPAQKSQAAVIPFTRRNWFRYAIAASVTLVIGLSAVLYAVRSGEKVDPATDSYAWVQKNLKSVSTDDLQQFVEMTDEVAAPNAIAANTQPVEVKDLLKNVSEKEIQDFLTDISPDDAMMN